MNNASAIDQISNDDLRWDGTALGLQPRISNAATARIVGDETVSDADLRALLEDPKRFAIAHVILTMRRREVSSFDANQWNGLHVILDATGTGRYIPADMAALARRWNARQ